MWIRRTLQVVLGGYVAYFLFLCLTIYCLPLTINDMIPLPFHVPVISPHRLSLNMSTVMLMVLVLVFCHEHDRLRRLFAIGRKNKPVAEFTAPATNLQRATPGVILVFLVAAIGAPAYVVLQNHAKTAEAKVMDDLEQEFRDRIQKVAQLPPQIQTRSSPDRPWDSLPYTKLPVMELELPQLSEFELNKALPRWKDGFNAESAMSIFSKGTGHWPYVPAFFTYAGTRYPVEVRYRGWNFDHYLGFKKSWRLKFRKNDLFHGRRQFNLINQRDHTAINDILWSEALRESGIMVPFQFLVHFRINGEFQGIQTFLEQPDRYFAERHNRNASDIYGEFKPIIRAYEFLKPENWQQYASAGLTNDLQPLLDLYAIALEKDHPQYRERIENVLDVDQYLKYLAHATITCAENPSTHNIRWIRDPGVGRFQILPWYQASSTFIIEGHRELLKKTGWNRHPPLLAINDFADGLLRHHRYRKVYLQSLWRMLRSTHHHAYLQRKIAELTAYVRSDAHADTHMHYRFDMTRYTSNAEWQDAIAHMRAMIDDRLKYLERTLEGGPVTVNWVADVKTPAIPGVRILGAIDLISTNYCDSDLSSIALAASGLTNGTPFYIGRELPRSDQKFKFQASRDGRISMSGSLPLSMSVERTPIPMGPGIIVDGLGAIKNPEVEFLGGVSQLAPWYRPVATTNRVYVATPDPNVSNVILRSLDVSNRITERRHCTVLTTGEQAGDPIRRPEYLDSDRQKLQSLPFANPRTPEQTVQFVEPDGTSLHDGMNVTVVRVPPGEHRIETNWFVGPNQALSISSNTTLRFAPGMSLIVRGSITADGATFTSLDTNGHWGSIFINPNRNTLGSAFTRCVIERSANVQINGMAVTAGIAAYSANCTVEHSIFRDMAADDAFNAKYGYAEIANCTFSNNLDAVDFDMGGGKIENSVFKNNQDDCIDLSSAWTLIQGNSIESHGDKGISVGEKSRPTIFNNVITRANMGIAVKDLSNALILNNTITNNVTAVAIYEKKASFGPATASLVNNDLHHNDLFIDAKNGSTATARFNAAPIPLPGEGNITAPLPDARTTAGSGKPASYYGLTNLQMKLSRIGHF
ncbi:MAG: CotH kinase family protein, partial [Limisphaerales bacterium]